MAAPTITIFITILVNNNLSNVFRKIVKLLIMLYTIHMTTAQSERCFSTLKRIKTFTGDTMGQERLCALAVSSVKKEFIQATENIDKLVVINNFVA